jgi:endonuclease/exonuclease/phosphatase family metal-dependent hydrolase
MTLTQHSHGMENTSTQQTPRPESEVGPLRLRIMSYNVHRCIGCDGLLAPQRIAEVIAQYEPDVVALQELDVGHARTRHADQPEVLAQALNMQYFFHPAVEAANERYGDAVLSRLPLQLIRAAPLPTLPKRPRLERRGALWVAVTWHGRTVQLVNTHLGLLRSERLAQVNALLGPEWLGHAACTAPRVCCGDFNAWPGTVAYGRLRRVLHDAQKRRRLIWRRNTYPSRFPFVCIDHVFHSPDLAVTAVGVPRTRLTRVASDHLPVIVDIALP